MNFSSNLCVTMSTTNFSIWHVFCRRLRAWNLSKWYLQYLPWKWRKKPIFQLNKTANFRKICRSWKKFKSPEFPVKKFWHFFIILSVVFYFHFFSFWFSSKQLHMEDIPKRMKTTGPCINVCLDDSLDVHNCFFLSFLVEQGLLEYILIWLQCRHLLLPIKWLIKG